MTQEQKEKIKKFFETLNKVTHSPGELYDLGLIVSDNLKIDGLGEFLPKTISAQTLILSPELHPDKFLEILVKSFQNKGWLLVELKDGYLSAQVYNQLRLLSTQNRLQIFDLSGERQEIDLKMPKESKIIFLTSQESLSKITNPNFLNLFGAVIKI